MKCNATIALLPWFLNDTLAPEEKSAVRDHLESCATCRKELENTHEAWWIFGAHPRPEDLTVLALARAGEPDTVGPGRRPLLERHLEQCAQCRDEAQLIGESHQHFLGSEGTATTTAPVVGAIAVPTVSANDNRPGRQWWLAAAAAMVLSLVSATGWWVSHQARATLSSELATLRSASQDAMAERLTLESQHQAQKAARRAAEERAELLETQLADLTQLADPTVLKSPAGLRPQLNLPVVDIYPEDMILRGGGAPAPEQIQLPANQEGLVLILGSQSNGEGPFTVELLTGDRVTWRGEGLKRQQRGEFTLTLPRRILPDGAFTLRVLNPAGQPVEQYRVRLTWG